MTRKLTGRAVDAGTLRAMRDSYGQLVKAGNDSVRASWRFGQCLDSFTDAYTVLDIANAMELSVSTIGRYLRFYRAYQRPELAEKAADQLETYNVDLLIELQNMLSPVQHARPLAGRRFRYRCQHCQSLDVNREEYEPEEVTA